MAVRLHEAGHFTWTEWAERLAGEIRRAQAAGDPDRGDTYYHHWLAALEGLVAEKGLVGGDELRRRKLEWDAAARATPHGKPIELRAAEWSADHGPRPPRPDARRGRSRAGRPLRPGPAAHATEGPTAADLREALESVHTLRVDGQPLRAPILREFYGEIGFEPVWGPDPAGSPGQPWPSTRSRERAITASRPLTTA